MSGLTTPPLHTDSPPPPLRPRWAWWRRLPALASFCLFAVPKAVWRAMVIAYFVIALSFILLSQVVAPNIAAHKDDIAAALSRQLGLPVSIASLDAEWRGLRPRLHMAGVKVLDASGRTALELPVVNASVAWLSILKWRAELRRIEIIKPDLEMRRDADGKIFIAGLHMQGGEAEPGAIDRLLAQREIVVQDARLSWRDALRGAPELVLEKVSLRLLNDEDNHRFVLLATPPAGLASPIELRADLRGKSLASLAEMEQWRGTVFLSVDRFDLAAWQRWVDYPLNVPAGRGGLRAWLNVDGPRIGSLTTDFALRDMRLRLAEDLPALNMADASGRLRLTKQDGRFSVAAERLRLQAEAGVPVAPTSFSLRRVLAQGAKEESGEIMADQLDIAPLVALAGSLPLPDALRMRLVMLAPRGKLSRLSASWQGPANKPAHFKLDARFADIALAPHNASPGIEGLSGSVQGTDREGRFALSIHQGGLWLPAVMPVPFVELNDGLATGSWSRPAPEEGKPQLLTVKLDSLKMHNADLSVEANGSWHGLPGEKGHLDMRARAQNGVASAVWKYMPSHVVGLSAWLHENLKSGVGEQASMRLRGDLEKFPFIDPASGEFRVDVSVRDASVDFAHGWPGMNGVRAQILFERDLMRITASEGYFGAVKLRKVQLDVPRLMEAGKQVMTVKGQASGPLPDFQTYVHASMLNESIGHFTRDLQAQGNGELDLQLSLPLHEINHSQVRGTFRFERSQLRLMAGLPLMSDASANIAFTEHDFSMADANGLFLGARVRATGLTEADGSQHFVAEGTVPVRNLNELVASPVWNALEGSAAARASIRVSKGVVDMEIDSTLRGVSSRLPSPLDKTADSSLPIKFVWQLANKAPNLATQTWRLKLERGIEAQWQHECDAQQCRFQRGALAVGETLSLPEKAWRFAGNFRQLDVDAWSFALKGVLPASTGGAAAGGELLAGVALRADELVALGYRFERVSARAVRQDERWVLRLDGPQLAGDLRYEPEGKGRVYARLAQLTLNSANPEADAGAAPESHDESGELPALNVVADHFQPHGLNMGRLELQATHRGGDWLLDKIAISNPDFTLEGQGMWRRPVGARSESRFDIRLDASDAGQSLGRLGHPNALRQGKAVLAGNIAWQGPPTSIEYASLAGSLRLDVSNGQFAKVETGMGRLLGVLSLQALPRRISLDFRDVFSEGFAFDSLRADLKLAKGIMSTQNLEIRGPAAKVYMHGSTDVARETHDLHISIQPALSEMVAVGALGAINPLVGVATYLAQKVLRDPVEKLFSFEYTVSGAWADPRINKVSSSLLGPSGSTPGLGGGGQ